MWAVASAWPTVRHWPLPQLLPGAAALAAGWLLMVVLLGRGWAGCLQALSGLQLPMMQWLPLQLSAWSGRYLPGKVGLLAGKLQICERGVSVKNVTASVVSEQIAFILTGAALSMLALPQLITWLPAPAQSVGAALIPWAPALLLLPLLAGGIAGAWLVRIRMPDTSHYWAARLLGWSLLGHLLAGTGFHCLLGSLLDTPPSWTDSVGLLAAAHTAGVLAVFAPAGLGVREAVIASALAPQLGWPQAVAMTALQRGLVVLVDAAIAVTALVWHQRVKL